MDDKLTTLLSNLPESSNYFSLEFFPPKTAQGFVNLQSRLHRMAHSLRPLFISITWGAGGSTATKSLELAEICQRQLGVPTVLHLTCTNMKKSVLDEALQACREIGIRNILALRGDRPRDHEYKPEGADSEDEQPTGDFVWAIDLVRYIRKEYGDHFCIGVAGYPEGHADESHPTSQDVEHDLPYLVEKTKAGADFIMTQLTYDLQAFERYETRLREHESGVFKTIPIIPGLMPIQSYQILRRITKLSHAKVPEAIMRRIEKVKTDDEQVKKLGVDILSEIVEGMRSLPAPPNGGRRGFHFYTLNLEKSVAFILERCRLIGVSKDNTPPPEEIAVSDSDAASEMPMETSTHKPPRRRTSSINAQPHNRIILDASQTTKRKSISPDHSRQNGAPALDIESPVERHQAPERGSGIPAANPTRKNQLLISEGQGSLGREATWDDFPNGRWGPSHSPAFGEIDGYGPSLKVGPVTARRLWGKPCHTSDITNIFRRHVLGEVGCVPWSDDLGESSADSEALRKETNTIKNQLLKLIDQDLWTLASQPAVNGVRNDHPIFGWGPAGEGFVFQKAFVEFFVHRDIWTRQLRSKLLSCPEEQVSWMATDLEDEFESSESARANASLTQETRNLHSSSANVGQTGVNAVTWGVFRGKEIVTPTIIEEASFRAWAEEAFGIWDEWRRVFPRGSEEEKFLDRCRKEVVLVNVVGQGFIGKDGEKVWEILGSKPMFNGHNDKETNGNSDAGTMNGQHESNGFAATATTNET